MPLYKSRITTSFPVAPGTSYLTRGVIQPTRLEPVTLRILTNTDRSRKFLRGNSGYCRLNVIQIPHIGQESDLLVDGTSEVLEREGVDEGVIRRRGVWFPNLEKSNVFVNVQ